MASLSGLNDLKDSAGLLHLPPRAPSIASWRGIRSWPGAGFFCLFFHLCSDSPASASRLEKGEVLLDFREIS